MRAISRRSFIKGGAITTASLMGMMGAMNLVGCSPQKQGKGDSSEYTPGSYTGEGMGRHGLITVTAEFSADAIESITIDEQNDTVGISDLALEDMPKRILEKQSLAVDAVSGATLTSMGVVAAVKDCVKQAGGDTSVLEKAVPKPDPRTENIETDVVVIGAGGAGLIAAIAAAKANAKVILIEKQDMVGGSTRTNGAMFLTTGTSEEVAGQQALDLDQTFQFYYNIHDTEYFAPGIAKAFVQEMEPIYSYITDNCFEPGRYVNQCYVAFDPKDPNSAPPMMTQYWPADWVETETEGEFVGIPDGIGYRFTTPLESIAKSLGVDILYGTGVTSIDVEGEMIGGVTAQNRENVTYEIKSRAVVIASGGYAANSDMRKKYWGDSSLEWFSAPTCDGACIEMAEQCGAKTAFVTTDGAWGGGYATLGGLVVDEATHVLDKNDQPIKNLFAAGEIADVCLMGTKYPMSGTMNAWSVFTGQLSGTNAAAL